MGNNILEENLESIEGYVDHIIYRNADNGYTVLVLVCNEEEETCVGVFSDIAEGENIKAKGSYTEHPTYGTSASYRKLSATAWAISALARSKTATFSSPCSFNIEAKCSAACFVLP